MNVRKRETLLLAAETPLSVSSDPPEAEGRLATIGSTSCWDQQQQLQSISGAFHLGTGAGLAAQDAHCVQAVEKILAEDDIATYAEAEVDA